MNDGIGSPYNDMDIRKTHFDNYYQPSGNFSSGYAGNNELEYNTRTLKNIKDNIYKIYEENSPNNGARSILEYYNEFIEALSDTHMCTIDSNSRLTQEKWESIEGDTFELINELISLSSSVYSRYMAAFDQIQFHNNGINQTHRYPELVPISYDATEISTNTVSNNMPTQDGKILSEPIVNEEIFHQDLPHLDKPNDAAGTTPELKTSGDNSPENLFMTGEDSGSSYQNPKGVEEPITLSREFTANSGLEYIEDPLDYKDSLNNNGYGYDNDYYGYGQNNNGYNSDDYYGKSRNSFDFSNIPEAQDYTDYYRNNNGYYDDNYSNNYGNNGSYLDDYYNRYSNGGYGTGSNVSSSGSSYPWDNPSDNSGYWSGGKGYPSNNGSNLPGSNSDNIYGNKPGSSTPGGTGGGSYDSSPRSGSDSFLNDWSNNGTGGVGGSNNNNASHIPSPSVKGAGVGAAAMTGAASAGLASGLRSNGTNYTNSYVTGSVGGLPNGNYTSGGLSSDSSSMGYVGNNEEDKKKKKNQYQFASTEATVDNPQEKQGIDNGGVVIDTLEPTGVNDSSNLGTIIGLGGITAGLGVGGAYLSEAKKEAEAEKKKKKDEENAEKLGLVGGIMGASFISDDDEEDNKKKKKTRNYFNSEVNNPADIKNFIKR